MKNTVKNIYKVVKKSSFWQKNQLTEFIYKLIQKCIGIILFIRHILRHVKHKLMLQVYRIKIIARIRKNLNKRGVYLHLARNAVTRKQWLAAHKSYQKLYDNVKDDPKQIELINESKMHLSVINRILNLQQYKQSIKKYNRLKSGKDVRGKKIAVVTAISGGYDSLKLPPILDPSFDYIFYTDTPSRSSGVYDIRPMPYFHHDKTRMARYIKTNLSALLPDYDIAIWVDASIMILEDISNLVNGFIESKLPVGAIPHPLRNSVFEEAKACISHAKDDAQIIKQQATHLKKIGYDCDDLIESGFMMFDLRNKKIPSFFNTWWAEIDKYSRRDQMSLNYALDTNKIKWHKLMKRPLDARNYPDFALVPHHTRQSVVIGLEKAIGSKSINPYAGDSFSKVKNEVLKKEANRRVDIVYCVHNALEDVKKCLTSVVKYRKNPNLKLIIIDDGSDIPTKKYLENFYLKHKKWTDLHRSETGSGYTKAANRGVKASGGELVVLLNSDTIVTDGWTEKLAHAAFSSNSIGIVGPLSSAASHQSIPDHLSTDSQTAVNSLPKGITPATMNKYCETWSTDFYPLVPLVHGFCFGIKREVINKVGYFDEDNFPNGYGEENDYCFRATDQGFRLAIVVNTYIYHAKSKSYLSSERIQYMKDGRIALQNIHTKERISRAVQSMEDNPILRVMRNKAAKLYKQQIPHSRHSKVE